MKLTGLAKEIFLDKYATAGEFEWEDCAKRVARHVSQAENGGQVEWQDKYFDVINNMDFIPGGRILFGAGRPRQSLLNCFALHPQDNVESLGEMLKNVYLISCQGGGLGFNFSDVRPRGDSIQNIRYSAPGTVSEMRKIDIVGQEVRGGKNRRSALLAILNVDHPDMLNFLHAKLDLKQLTNFNISVGITNDFIKAVEKNKEWKFTFNNRVYYVFEVDRIYRNGKKETIRLTAFDDEDALGRACAGYKRNFTDKFNNPKKIEYKAKELWDTIINNARTCGDPGLFNLSMVNSYTNVSYFEQMHEPNPCSEIPLPHGGNCCLGSVNLANMFDEKKNDVNWKKLAKVIKAGVRFLDNVLTINNYPIPLTKEVSNKSRRIGLGVMGLHYLLIRMGYRYGSEESLEFLERLFATFRNESYLASIEIAIEKGVFPAFDSDEYLKEEYAKNLPQRIRRKIKKHGIRNATILTSPPTGTTSIVVGVSSGIEPIFSPVYKRSYRDPEDSSVWKHAKIIDRLFKEFYIADKDVSHIVGAYDITPEEHLNVQATVQRFVDSSISKTINVPENITADKLSGIILEFIRDLKGVTIYRQNSRDMEPLQIIDISKKKELEKIMMEAEEESNSIDGCKGGSCEL